jgi:hypothetical protein
MFEEMKKVSLDINDNLVYMKSRYEIVRYIKENSICVCGISQVMDFYDIIDYLGFVNEEGKISDYINMINSPSELVNMVDNGCTIDKLMRKEKIEKIKKRFNYEK